MSIKCFSPYTVVLTTVRAHKWHKTMLPTSFQRTLVAFLWFSNNQGLAATDNMLFYLFHVKQNDTMTTAMSSCTMRMKSANHLTHACHCLRFVLFCFFFLKRKSITFIVIWNFNKRPEFQTITLSSFHSLSNVWINWPLMPSSDINTPLLFCFLNDTETSSLNPSTIYSSCKIIQSTSMWKN